MENIHNDIRVQKVRKETFTVISGQKGEKIDTENWFKFPSNNDNNNNNNNNNNDKNYQTLLG